eukprot:GHVR01043356.1.p1 GENE.GHVR01043356.1~~GHVR01043356.1.p1  ORF type:complete len:198 (+),score=44.51 GHVR01043356.1:168-761(+)
MCNNYSKTDGMPIESPLHTTQIEISSALAAAEHVYIHRACEEALINQDEIGVTEEEESPTSTLVDDLFFIMQSTIRRAMTSAEVVVVCVVVNHVCATLSQIVRERLTFNLSESRRLYQPYIQDPSHLRNFVTLDAVPESHRPTAQGPIGSCYSWCHSLSNVEACLVCVFICMTYVCVCVCVCVYKVITFTLVFCLII